ncbi:hypothetical protein SCUCBS95973_002302 [Sporothrix curviconia]|uniref:Uncharacterized protein n=1 Tax=Sporothrix curviconia TaxID=1260050 RepID=A0ABP0B6K3_9PEZI
MKSSVLAVLAVSASGVASSACRPNDNGLYSCFLSSVNQAATYCSTAASVFLTASTTVTFIEPTQYVEVVESATSTAVATVSSLRITGTSYDYTSADTWSTTTIDEGFKFVKRGADGQLKAYIPEPTLKARGASAALPAPTDVVTIKALKHIPSTSLVCTTPQSTTTATSTLTLAKNKRHQRSLGQRIGTAGSGSEPACVEAINPADEVLTSVCAVFVSSYGTTPSPVTETIVLPTVTLTSGSTTATAVVSSTSTKVVLTVVEVTGVSTTTVTTCTPAIKTFIAIA